MTTIPFSGNGTTPFEKLIGYNPAILNSWNILEYTFWKESVLDKDMLEQIRRAMAFENGCEYCMVKAGRPDFNAAQVKVSAAAAFAELFCKDHQSILPAHFDMLREYFTDYEISELCAFIAFINASQKLGKIFNLSQYEQPDAAITL